MLLTSAVHDLICCKLYTVFNLIVFILLFQGPQSSFQSKGVDPPLLKCSGGGGRGGLGVVGLWTFKMVYLVLTQFFLIKLIDHLFNNFTNGKGVSNKKKLHQHRN